MNATRRSIRLTMTGAGHWEVSALDTEYFQDGKQVRRIAYINLVLASDIRRVAHALIEEHLCEEEERYYQAQMEAAERE